MQITFIWLFLLRIRIVIFIYLLLLSLLLLSLLLFSLVNCAIFYLKCITLQIIRIFKGSEDQRKVLKCSFQDMNLFSHNSAKLTKLNFSHLWPREWQHIAVKTKFFKHVLRRMFRGISFVLFNKACIKATISHGIFETGSSFRVGWCTAGGV